MTGVTVETQRKGRAGVAAVAGGIRVTVRSRSDRRDVSDRSVMGDWRVMSEGRSRRDRDCRSVCSGGMEQMLNM